MPARSSVKPFQFETCSSLLRITPNQARSLKELLEGIRRAGDAVIYHHTYEQFMEQHFVPEIPRNDFAKWVGEVLRIHPLDERLAAVDPFELGSIEAVRDALVHEIESHLQGDGEDRQVARDQAFHFMESVNVISRLPLVVGEVQELKEALRRAPLQSIYYHFLEARLRSKDKTNDFSLWLSRRGHEDLARDFERIDVSIMTLESARDEMIRAIDRRRLRTRVGWTLGLGTIGTAAVGGVALLRRAARGRNNGGNGSGNQ